MSDSQRPSTLTRRQVLGRLGTLAIASAAAPTVFELTLRADGAAQAMPLAAVAGHDRFVMAAGRTYLNGWVGYGAPPRPGRSGRRGGGAAPAAPEPAGPAPSVRWAKLSGPGAVTFADAGAPVTTAMFSTPGDYVLQVTADNGVSTATSTVAVTVEPPPPATALAPVTTGRRTVTSPMWAARTKALITAWIPHCVAQMNRTDLVQGPNSGSGGLDNFIEAGKALRGEPHTAHKGYVFSNAWVHQTVEAMSLALMIDAEGDREILDAQARMRDTLDDWIPKILAAQHPDGYLQTAYTLRGAPPVPPNPPGPWRDGVERWTPESRGNHEGYTGGYFLESAINHFEMTGRKDSRLYDAATRLANCWADRIGPAPKQEWFDGHQEMEQALVRFAHCVNDVEGAHAGDRYVALAKFLLDCRRGGTEYDQSHLPVVQQYEAVGHAVRAMYTYSGMTDVAIETRDVDYQSAVRSLWDNVGERKYYLTGGVGSGESSEGFGPDYSLPNHSYCETCSSCGAVFFQWKMHRLYHDARFVDRMELTLYNALYGGLDLAGGHFYYTNPLDQNAQRTTWHSCPCCVGNLSRTMLMLPTWTYATDAGGLYVNLFIGGRATVAGVAGTDVELVQTTDYPWSGKVRIEVRPATPARFTLRVRVPNRDAGALYTLTPRVDGLKTLTVNGAGVKPDVVKGYAAISRTWKAGDVVEVELPMQVQRVHASARIVSSSDRNDPARDAPDRGKVALRYGPLIYNIEQVDQDLTGAIDPAAPLETAWRPDLLGGVMVITGKFADGTPFVAVPNFARYNRNPPAPPPAAPAPRQPGQPVERPAPPPPQSIVWIREA